jgi:hypothetical protein
MRLVGGSRPESLPIAQSVQTSLENRERLACLDDAERFLPPGPPSLDSVAYAADLNQLKAVGGKVSTERTAEQSATATFWSDFSYTETPPGHWLDIACSIAHLLTPAFPEYVSGHSTFSMASALVIGSCYGTDALTFRLGSDAVPGVLRTYDSLIGCANEIGG